MPRPRKADGRPKFPPEPRGEVEQRYVNDGRLWFVYVFGRIEGCYKIGYSGDAEKRLLRFATLPVDLRMFARIETYRPLWAERYVHTAFHDRRVRGEWFRLTDDDLAILATVKSLGFGWTEDDVYGAPAALAALHASAVAASPEAMEMDEIERMIRAQFVLAPDEERDVAEYVARRQLDRLNWDLEILESASRQTLAGEACIAVANRMKVAEARAWLAKRRRKPTLCHSNNNTPPRNHQTPRDSGG